MPLDYKAVRPTFVLILLTLFGVACQRDAQPGPRGDVQGVTPVAAEDKQSGGARGSGVTHHKGVDGEAIGDDVFVGAPKQYGHLTVFPILAKTQVDVGPIMPLNEALKSGSAEVRELGSAGGAPSGAPQEAVQEAQQDDANENGAPQRRSPRSNDDAPEQQRGNGLNQQLGGDSAEVGKLAIENKGKVPVYVLAGTIVKGGKQDRQVGQDFIIGAKETVPIDAFCVEQGRWNGNRGGVATGGKFEAVEQLANREVRVAGQYKDDQSEVWTKVSKVNSANKKSSKSSSLLATADDAELKKARDTLRATVLADLDAVKPKAAVVGYAYAIGDKVAGVRWFAHHDVFVMFRKILINTAIADALTAKASGAPLPKSAVPAKRVAAFIEEARKAPVAKAKNTGADNFNEYKESDGAYGSSTIIKAEKTKKKRKVKMSVDFSAK